MILLDTNVLIYASSPESDFHDRAVAAVAPAMPLHAFFIGDSSHHTVDLDLHHYRAR